MAISRAQVFNTASTATSGSSITPAWPATVNAGDLGVLVVLSKRGVTISTPSGWTLDPNAEFSGGAGADGANSGTVKATVFYKVAAGTEDGTTVTVSFSGGTTNVVTGRIGTYQNATGSWSIAAANGADSAGGNSGWTATTSSDPGITANDLIIALFGCNSSTPTHSAESLTTSGVTYGTLVEQLDAGVASGDTVRFVLCEVPVSSGTSSGNTTFAGTASTNGTNYPAGPIILLRLREVSAGSIDRARQARAALRMAANARRIASAQLLRLIQGNAPLARSFVNAQYGTATPGTGLSGVGHDGGHAASRLRRIKRRRN